MGELLVSGYRTGRCVAPLARSESMVLVQPRRTSKMLVMDLEGLKGAGNELEELGYCGDEPGEPEDDGGDTGGS